jgi:hypothetical protein
MTRQADHYIIRLAGREPAAADVDDLIEDILRATGYSRGDATVDFAADPSPDEAYMTGLVLIYEERTGHQVDYHKSKMVSFHGRASGRLVAAYHRWG